LRFGLVLLAPLSAPAPAPYHAAPPMLDFIDAQFLVSVTVILIVIHVILITVAYLIYLERKISAYIQDRIGPNRVGPLGLLQPIADGLKFMLKEDYRPTGADKILFTMAPLIVIVPALIGWAVIPWGGWWVTPEITLPLLGTIESQTVLIAAANVNIGVIFLLAIAAMGVYGITLGGWASNNKYSFFGGLRASAGMISYEIPLGIAILTILLTAGSVHPQRLIELQSYEGWYILAHPIAALTFFVCILAEANRAPFDNAEAEQELVGGYHTEYSSMRFALFFLAEYSHMITSSAFLILLFFGGYHLPFIGLTHPESTGLLAVLAKCSVFFFKVLLVISFQMVIRWTVPRIRWDQVMKLAWNDLIPISIAIIVTTSVFVYVGWTAWWQMLLMNAAVGAVILAIMPLLPKLEINKRIPLAGSRFNPLPGEQVRTMATGLAAQDDAPGAATGRSERVSDVQPTMR